MLQQFPLSHKGARSSDVRVPLDPDALLTTTPNDLVTAYFAPPIGTVQDILIGRIHPLPTAVASLYIVTDTSGVCWYAGQSCDVGGRLRRHRGASDRALSLLLRQHPDAPDWAVRLVPPLSGTPLVIDFATALRDALMPIGLITPRFADRLAAVLAAPPEQWATPNVTEWATIGILAPVACKKGNLYRGNGTHPARWNDWLMRLVTKAERAMRTYAPTLVPMVAPEGEMERAA